MTISLSTVEDVAANGWFRALAPVVVLLSFELLVRYIGKSDRQRMQLSDWFLAMPLLSASVGALPGLIALRAANGATKAEIGAGGFVLTVLVLVSCWLALIDRRTLSKHRRDNPGAVTVLWTTALPTLLAAAGLALVFAYIP